MQTRNTLQDPVAADGSENHLIHCFKEGEPWASGREPLAQTRQGELAEEEENDEEKFNNWLVVEDNGDEKEEDIQTWSFTVYRWWWATCLPSCFTGSLHSSFVFVLFDVFNATSSRLLYSQGLDSGIIVQPLAYRITDLPRLQCLVFFKFPYSLGRLP